jgi:hypothetical protein
MFWMSLSQLNDDELFELSYQIEASAGAEHHSFYVDSTEALSLSEQESERDDDEEISESVVVKPARPLNISHEVKHATRATRRGTLQRSHRPKSRRQSQSKSEINVPE